MLKEGIDCMPIVLDHITVFGFGEAHGEFENAHCAGRRQFGKASHITACIVFFVCLFVFRQVQ